LGNFNKSSNSSLSYFNLIRKGWCNKSIFPNIYALITYQNNPKIICSLFSVINSGWILTTTQPIALEEEIAKFKFSFILNIFKGFFLLMALSSIVPG